MKELIQILMDRDGMTCPEALQAIREFRVELYARMDEGEDPTDIIQEELGLEPDYLDLFI